MVDAFDTPNVFTRLLSLSWWLIYPPLTILAGRLFWERTWLTWISGRQAIGFTLAHQHQEILVFGFLGGIGIVIWGVLTLVVTLRRRNRVLALGQVQIALSGLSLFVLLLGMLPIDQLVLKLRE